MAERHHGITGRETASGKIPIRDPATAVIAMLAFADDADEETFPLNTPVLVTSINRVLPKAGTTGNLRKNLEIISQITSPTLVVIRIESPYSTDELDQSLVIGTTEETGQRTGLQALLTVKSVLGLTPKIICVPDVETIDIANAIGAICKKLRAYSYITPRNRDGVILETAYAVVNFRNMLAFREVELIWPEWTSGNVFLGSTDSELEFTEISIQSLPLNHSVALTYDLYRNGENLEANQTIVIQEPSNTADAFLDSIIDILETYPDITLNHGGGGIGHFFRPTQYTIRGNAGDLEKDTVRFVFKQNPSEENDLFPMLKDRYSGLPFTSPLELITLGKTMYEGV